MEQSEHEAVNAALFGTRHPTDGVNAGLPYKGDRGMLPGLVGAMLGQPVDAIRADAAERELDEAEQALAEIEIEAEA